MEWAADSADKELMLVEAKLLVSVVAALSAAAFVELLQAVLMALWLRNLIERWCLPGSLVVGEEPLEQLSCCLDKDLPVILLDVVDLCLVRLGLLLCLGKAAGAESLRKLLLVWRLPAD